jgi:ribonuclease-3 family protein
MMFPPDWTYDGDPKDVPVSTLAYIGDAVYELYVRLYVLRKVTAGSGKLHRLSVHFVQAGFQAAAAERIGGLLSEAEAAVYRRGRNSDPGTMAKHADPLQYRKATGLETLLGWLYLQKRPERISELMQIILATEEPDGYGGRNEQSEPTT